MCVIYSKTLADYSIKPIKVKRNLKTTDTEYTNKICFAAKQKSLCEQTFFNILYDLI